MVETSATTMSASPSHHYYGFADRVFEIRLHEPDAPHAYVPEAFVHDLWRHQRFDGTDLLTVGGMPVQIEHQGRLNSDSGPDFLDASLRIGATSWRGAVEIHTTSGLWFDHGHDRDPVYNATLLHVTLYSDIWTGRLRRADGSILPEIVLYPRLEMPLRRLIHAFHTQVEREVLCAAGWGRVPDAVRAPWVRALGLERLDAKKRRFSSHDLEAALHEAIFTGLGYAKNAAAMRTLARIVPLPVARRMESAADAEALLLGAAGLLPAPADLLDADRETADYAMELADRFERLNHHLAIQPMPVTAWRFFRLRPANFPPVRIAQAAALVAPPGGFLRDAPLQRAADIVLDHPQPIRMLRSLFDVTLDPFWRTHVRLDRRSRLHKPSLGRSRIDAILVNALLPALGAYADRIKHQRLAHAVADIVSRIPAGDDEVTRLFADLGTAAADALQAQGLHQLYRTRCTEARCLDCEIGRYLLAENEEA